MSDWYEESLKEEVPTTTETPRRNRMTKKNNKTRITEIPKTTETTKTADIKKLVDEYNEKLKEYKQKVANTASEKVKGSIKTVIDTLIIYDTAFIDSKIKLNDIDIKTHSDEVARLNNIKKSITSNVYAVRKDFIDGLKNLRIASMYPSMFNLPISQKYKNIDYVEISDKKLFDAIRSVQKKPSDDAPLYIHKDQIEVEEKNKIAKNPSMITDLENKITALKDENNAWQKIKEYNIPATRNELTNILSKLKDLDNKYENVKAGEDLSQIGGMKRYCLVVKN